MLVKTEGIKSTIQQDFTVCSEAIFCLECGSTVQYMSSLLHKPRIEKILLTDLVDSILLKKM